MMSKMPSRHNQVTDELNQLPIWEVAALVGATVPKAGSCHCPFPDHEDSTPSFSVYSNGRKWKCFGCNRNGRAIDFVKLYLGTDFMSAKRLLERYVNKSTSLDRDLIRSIKRAPDTHTVKSNSHQPDPQLFKAFLDRSPMLRSGRSYLNQRGITDETIEHFRLGQISNARGTMREIIAHFGYERASHSGLLAKSSQPNYVLTTLWDESIVFPFYHSDKLIYFQSRAIHEGQRKRKWQNLVGISKPIYNFDAVTHESKTIWICEGAMDVLSAWELGAPAIGILGVSTRLTEEITSKLKNKLVRIVMDWDHQGQSKAQELLFECDKRGILTEILSQPDPNAYDLNDYLVLRKSSI